MKKILSLFFVLVLILLTACGNTSTPQTTTAPAPANNASTETTPNTAAVETVKIALITSMSGQSADLGRMSGEGINFAADRVNASGGIKSLNGAKVEIIQVDLTSDPAQSKNVVERLVADNKIVAILCHGTSAVSLPTLPVVEKNQIPLVTSANAKEITGQGYKYVFSFTPPAVMVGAAQPEFLKWLNEEKGFSYKKVALIYENSSYGISTAEGMRNRIPDMGLEIVYDESFQSGLTDASSIATAIIQSGAEVVIPSTYTNDNKMICDAMRSMNFYPLLMGASAWQSFGEDMGDAANGFIATGNWNHMTKNMYEDAYYKAINDDFAQKYGYNMSDVTGAAYCGFDIVYQALEACGSTNPVDVRNAISALDGKTLMQPGTIKFDENGQNVNAVVTVQQWQYGQCVAVWPEEYAAGRFIDTADFLK